MDARHNLPWHRRRPGPAPDVEGRAMHTGYLRQTMMAALALVLAASAAVHGQAPQPAAPASSSVQGLSPEVIDSLVASARPDVPATLTVANREVVVLQAALIGRSSADRVRNAAALIDTLSRDVQTFQVASRSLRTAAIISVNGRDVLAIVPADVDQLTGETVEARAGAAAARLDVALREIAEARGTRLLLMAVAEALLATLVFAAAIWALVRIRRWATGAAERVTEERLRRTTVGDEIVRHTRLLAHVRQVVTASSVLVGLVLTYVWLSAVLRRFPYTRPWGESLRWFLMDRAEWAVNGIVHAIPDLATVALIFIVTRLLNRLVLLLFAAVEQGRMHLPGIYPETAAPTRRLATALLWLFALVVSYPYLPGSNTDAFKGVSVFLGLMVSLGSSGLVNQVMSGFTVTYSRALRAGDFVRVGDVEGTVVQIGMLSTKIETPRHEEVTIPNAVLISQTATNYSRNADRGVFLATDVTIGYDTPWRQVEALMLLAVSRTSGVRQEPPPRLLQAGLEDFYVRYRLVVCPEDPRTRWFVLDRLHANIQDAFNEHGVQIMSPNYVLDPKAPKVVPKEQWFAPPAVKPSPGGNRT